MKWGRIQFYYFQNVSTLFFKQLIISQLIYNDIFTFRKFLYSLQIQFLLFLFHCLFFCPNWIFFFFFFGLATSCRMLVPQPGIKPGPLQCKCRVLTTGPPGNSLEHFKLLWSYGILWYLKDYSPHFPFSKNFLVLLISISCIVMYFHYLKSHPILSLKLKIIWSNKEINNPEVLWVFSIYCNLLSCLAWLYKTL